MPHPIHNPARTLALAALLLVIAGCHSAQVDKSVISGLGDTDANTRDVEFWSRLYGNKILGNDDAMHGLILYFYNEDKCEGYAQRVDLLKEKGLLDKSFSEPAEHAFTRGTFAVAIAQGLKVEGGVLHSLFPMSQRYAIRHLQSEELFPMSSPNQTVSGTDFVGIVGRAEDYERSQEAAKAEIVRDIEKVNPNQRREH